MVVSLRFPNPRKRHRAWSNCYLVYLLNRGVLRKADREACLVKSTKKSSSGGRTTYSGNQLLKQTQSEAYFCYFVLCYKACVEVVQSR